MLDYILFMLDHPHVFIVGIYIASLINLVVTTIGAIYLYREFAGSDQIRILNNGSVITFKSYDSIQRKYQGTGKDWISFEGENNDTGKC